MSTTALVSLADARAARLAATPPPDYEALRARIHAAAAELTIALGAAADAGMIARAGIIAAEPFPMIVATAERP